MGEITNVPNLMDKAEIRKEVKVIVGGAPIDVRFTKDVGSDGYGKRCGSARSSSPIRQQNLILLFYPNLP